MAVINIGGADGAIIPLRIFANDNPTILAKAFVSDNGLPNEIIAKLTNLIQSHISQALTVHNEMLNQYSGSDSEDNSVESVTNKFNNLLNRGSQYRNFYGNSDEVTTPSKFTSLDRDDEKQQTPIQTHHSEESFNKAKEIWTSASNRSLMDVRRPDSILSSMKKSRSDLNLLTGSVNGGDARSSASRPRSPSALSAQLTPNRPVYDRLYQEAGHSQQRLDRLRDRVEEQREEAVWSSSFM